MVDDVGLDILYFKSTPSDTPRALPLCEVLNGEFDEWQVGDKKYGSKEAMQADLEKALSLKIHDFVVKKGNGSNELEIMKFLKKGIF